MRGAPVRAGFVFPIRSIFDDSVYVTNKMVVERDGNKNKQMRSCGNKKYDDFR